MAYPKKCMSDQACLLKRLLLTFSAMQPVVAWFLVVVGNYPKVLESISFQKFVSLFMNESGMHCLLLHKQGVPFENHQKNGHVTEMVHFWPCIEKAKTCLRRYCTYIDLFFNICSWMLYVLYTMINKLILNSLSNEFQKNSIFVDFPNRWTISLKWMIEICNHEISKLFSTSYNWRQLIFNMHTIIGKKMNY